MRDLNELSNFKADATGAYDSACGATEADGGSCDVLRLTILRQY